MTSILKVSEIQDPTNSNTAISIDAAGKVTAPNLAMPAGSVLQVVHNTQTGSSASSTTLSYADTGLSVSITPSSTTSKILVFANTNVAAGRASYTARYDIRLVNNDASVIGCDKRYVGTDYLNYGNLSLIDALQGYFSPASTSSQTFKVQARIANGATNQAANLTLGWHTDAIHTITAMEIAG